MERVMHRMGGLHFVDEPDLDLVAEPKLPVDVRVLGAGLTVDDQPAHVRRRRRPVDLAHVVFPFDPFSSAVRVAPYVVVLARMRVISMLSVLATGTVFFAVHFVALV